MTAQLTDEQRTLLALDDPTWTDDPEPDDDEDDGPWCRWSRDLWGQHATSQRLDTMTDVPLTGSYL